MELRLYYVEKVYNGFQHDGYQDPILQYKDTNGDWKDVKKVYSDDENKEN